MAVKQGSSFAGVEVNEDRPGATIQHKHLEDASGDLAMLYERITDESVHSSVAAAVSGHLHDGTTGAPIRIPWVQQEIWANLHPRDQTWANSNTPGYEPFVIPCFFVPAGITTARAWILSPNGMGSAINTLRVESYDSSGNSNNATGASYQHRAASAGWFGPKIGGLKMFYWDIDVTAGEVNYVQFQAWDGYTQPGDDKELGEEIPDVRQVIAFGVGPVKQPNPDIYEWREPYPDEYENGASDLNVADTFQHFDTAMLSDDMPVSLRRG